MLQEVRDRGPYASRALAGRLASAGMLMPVRGNVKATRDLLQRDGSWNSLSLVRPKFTLRLRSGRNLLLGGRTLVVGVLNVTPDSFSDGGENIDPRRAVDRAFDMEAEGADIIEIGGESTRPGAMPVSAEDEKDRILPVLSRLHRRLAVPVSVDTYKSEVAAQALKLGADIINDVSALRFDPELAALVAAEGAALVLMHMRASPASMQQVEPSRDIFAEIESDLTAAVQKAMRAGITPDQIVLDPGVGFGKTLEQNLEIINRLDQFLGLGFPVMIGTSRKSFIGRITGRTASDRLFGTAASVAASILRGAHLVRVHDVKSMVEVARVTDAILGEKSADLVQK